MQTDSIWAKSDIIRVYETDQVVLSSMLLNVGYVRDVWVYTRYYSVGY